MLPATCNQQTAFWESDGPGSKMSAPKPGRIASQGSCCRCCSPAARVRQRTCGDAAVVPVRKASEHFVEDALSMLDQQGAHGCREDECQQQ